MHGRLAVEQKLNFSPHTTAVHHQTENYCAVVDVLAVGLDMSRSGESHCIVTVIWIQHMTNFH